MGFVHHESRELASDFYHVANIEKKGYVVWSLRYVLCNSSIGKNV